LQATFASSRPFGERSCRFAIDRSATADGFTLPIFNDSLSLLGLEKVKLFVDCPQGDRDHFMKNSVLVERARLIVYHGAVHAKL